MDDAREVSFEIGEQFKNDNNLDYFMEISAKSNDDTKNLFAECAKLIYDDIFNSSNSITSYCKKKIMVRKNDRTEKCNC